MSVENACGFRNWLALFGVMLGAFMAVLDIQITNSSLNDISGALGSSIEEGSWISTAYLVAEIVAIGISGIMAEIFSLKRYLIFSAIGFLIFSVLCAFSKDLGMMILFRACQGITGGALIPLAFNVILTIPASIQTADWYGALRDDRHLRSFHRTDDWRLADRQLRLAVDFLHQCRTRPGHAGDHLVLPRGRPDGPRPA